MHLIQQIEELEVEMHRLRESGEETTAQLELLERGKKKTEAEIKEKEAALKLADQRAEERRAELDNVRKVRKRHQVSVKAFFEPDGFTSGSIGLYGNSRCSLWVCVSVCLSVCL